MRISDWSSDVCSSDLVSYYAASGDYKTLTAGTGVENNSGGLSITFTASTAARSGVTRISGNLGDGNPPVAESITPYENAGSAAQLRSEEHTSELQSLMRTSYAVFCLKKKQKKIEQKL